MTMPSTIRSTTQDNFNSCVRSFGDDPTKVARYAKAVGDGLTQGGVTPSAKYFPGHGDTNIDSHLGPPVIKKSRVELDQTELKPFKELISAGIASIMMGHMVIPALTGDSETLASLSRAVTTTLLRDELRFEGVVVTDCLEMNGVKKTMRRTTWCCGSISGRGAMEGTYEAVRKGELNMDELRKIGARITTLKQEFAGTWDDVLGKPFGKKIVVMTPVVESLNTAVDDGEGVQRTDEGHVRNTAAPYYMSFAESVRRRAADVEHLVYAADFDCKRDFGEGIIFVTRNADRSAWHITKYNFNLAEGTIIGRFMYLLDKHTSTFCDGSAIDFSEHGFNSGSRNNGHRGQQYDVLPAGNGGEEREGDTPPLSFGAGWPYRAS
ncbi:glycoside hydrolase superfamily [Suillus lakei]|nr:glycoside hydrolase superfamily [Suillus lakei]